MPIDKTAATTVKVEPGDGTRPGRRTGTVKWFDALKGFGFITPTNPGDDDVFVYQSDIYTPGNFRTLNQNEPVEYGVEVYENGKVKAINVTGPSGNCVVGGADPRPAAREQQRKEASFRAQEQRGPATPGQQFTEQNKARVQLQRPAVPSQQNQPQQHGLPAGLLNPVVNPIHTLFGVQQLMGMNTIPTPEQYAIYYQNYQQQMHIGRVQAQHTHAHQVAIRAAQVHAAAAQAQAQSQTSSGAYSTTLATQQAAWGFQQAQAAQAAQAQAQAATAASQWPGITQAQNAQGGSAVGVGQWPAIAQAQAAQAHQNAANAAAAQLSSWQSMPALQAPGLSQPLNASATAFGPMQAPRSSSSERPAPYGQNPGSGARGGSKAPVSRL